MLGLLYKRVFGIVLILAWSVVGTAQEQAKDINEFLSHEIMLKERIELKDSQEGFAGVSGEVWTIDQSGKWETARFLNQTVNEPHASGQLTQEQLEELGNVLAVHNFSDLPQHFGHHGKINRRFISIRFGAKKVSLEMIGGESLAMSSPQGSDPEASKRNDFVAIVDSIKKLTSQE